MKKVLLTTTAVAFTAGMASAGEMSMSGSVKLTYGNFGTGLVPVTTPDDFTSEADLDIAATSTGGGITMTGVLELSEAGADAGPVTISSGALTFTYDANDLGALAMAPTGAGTDGEDDNYGDYSVAFSAGGIGVVYTKDQETSDNVVAVSYTAGSLGLTMTARDETNGAGAGYAAGTSETVIGATYTTGPYTIAVSGNDAAVQAWDASVAMVSGDTTVTLSSDENEEMKVAIGYTSGAMTVSAAQEFNGDDETEISLSYTEGALTFGAAYDSGQGTAAAPTYGDEAALVISAGYTDGDVTIAAKGTDQDEMEVSVTFAF